MHFCFCQRPPSFLTFAANMDLQPVYDGNSDPKDAIPEH